MPIIKPFNAIRPTKETAEHIAALPYDVFKRAEAKKEIENRPLSFLRIDRAETTLDDSVDMYDPAVYDQAKKNLNNLLDNKYLIKEEKPVLYLYELKDGDRSQTGLVASTSVDEYLDGTIKRHELTRRDKEEDRIKHVDVLNANTGPIFLTYKHNDEINNIVSKIKEEPKLFEFVTEDGIEQNVWIIDEDETIEKLEDLFKQINNFYIADGHHRCASAVRVAQKRREENKGYTGDEEFNYFLSVIFPDNELSILDYNRVVKDLNGLTKDEFLDKVSESFEVTESEIPVKPSEKAEFGMYLDGQWYTLKLKDTIPEDIVSSLDVSILYDKILAPILDIGDPRTDKRIDFIGGIKGLNEIERRANKDMKVGFSLYPTSLDELMSIADNNLLMPPKSTWFEPKLRSGLFIHELS